MDAEHTADPDLHLLVDGARIAPLVRDGAYCFTVPLPAHDVRLLSRTGRPSELGLGPDDRLLGYAIRHISLAASPQGQLAPIAIDGADPRLIDGFHDPEPSGLRWTSGDGRLPPPLFNAPLAKGAASISLTISGYALPAYPLPDPRLARIAALFDRFESLGDDCEFGLAQRHHKAEPLSLLRWISTDTARLIAGLRTRFDGLGDSEHTHLAWTGAPPEYKLRDPRYLSAHTWVLEPCADPAAEARLLGAGRARLRLLRRKFLDDIARARRILVYKSTPGDATDADFAALHAALRAIGPARLLCVRIAQTAEDIGRVDRLADGLYLGHIDRFDRGNVSHGVWLALCAATARLVDTAP